jgi:hypothetical protein
MFVARDRRMLASIAMKKRGGSGGGGDWDAIKKAFDADALARQQSAARQTPEERVLNGLRTGASAPGAAAVPERELERLAAEQALLHARWRWLETRRGGER